MIGILQRLGQSDSNATSHTPNDVDHSVDFFVRIVQRERRSDCCLHTKPAKRWLGAVMARSDCNPRLIERFADLFRRVPVQHKRNHTDFFFGSADDPKPWNRGELLRRIFCQCMLMGCNIAKSNPLHIFERSSQPNGICNIGCSCFELRGGFCIRCLLESDVLDHIATPLPWWQYIMQAPRINNQESFIIVSIRVSSVSHPWLKNSLQKPSHGYTQISTDSIQAPSTLHHSFHPCFIRAASVA